MESEGMGVAFRKDDVSLRNRIQSILTEMNADGTLNRISTDWFGVDITIVK